MHKAALRQQYLQKRLAMPETEWQDKSQQLVAQILLWMKGRSFEQYILYRSFRREPSLEGLAQILPSDVTYYPRVQGRSMNFYCSDGTFITNKFGIEEPAADPSRELKAPNASCLLIIPAVAYDEQCFRLGYGGGFFDRFLAQHALTTLGVCFEGFLLNALPREPHDQPVQTVITEKRALTRHPINLLQ